MKLFVLIAFCLLASGCVPAAVTNSPGAYGRVIDARTQAPIAHATVAFPGRGPAVTTDSDGRYDLPHTTKLGIVVLLPFEFQRLPMQVSHPGYQTAMIQVFTASDHKRQDVSLERQP